MSEVSPLHVLLTVMRTRWKDKDLDGAVTLAKAAAPYVHGRAMTALGPGELSEMPDDWLEDDVEAGRADAAGGRPQ